MTPLLATLPLDAGLALRIGSHALLWLFWLGLAYGTGYVLVFALAGRLRRSERFPRRRFDGRVVVLLPAYREDAVIGEAVAACRAQEDPGGGIDVVVIAQQLRPDTVAHVRQLGAQVLEVDFEAPTKALALRAALEALPADRYAAAVVFDADNLPAPDAVRRLTDALGAGFLAAQGQRVAKNLDTPLARLDALSEAFNNHVFRAGHRALGLSAALIGSGMAFAYAPFRAAMAAATAVGGFDKELELRLLRAGVRVAYAPEARVQDEKVRRADVFVQQRARWLAAQGHYARRHVGPALACLVRGQSLDYVDKVAQTLLPPRAFLLLGVPLGTGLAALAGQALAPWVGLGLALGLAFALGLPRAAWSRQTLRDAGLLPRALGLMVRALGRSRTANRRFLHTPHGAPASPAAPSL